MDYINQYLDEVHRVVDGIDKAALDSLVRQLVALREGGGRLFFIGVGGGAGNASHAVNDFRKIAGIESYAPTDNVSELTARVNDDGWDSSFERWLKGSRLDGRDGVFVFSVGGGSEEKNISMNIVKGLKHAKKMGARVFGIVGRDGGYTARVADACIIVPTISAATVTAHTESFQAVIWHLIVSHPKMLVNEMKWESVK
jgi:D-sedoheptulose 7-phosphate isomerase